MDEVGATDSDTLPLVAMFAEDGTLPESEVELALVEDRGVGVTDSLATPPVDATNTADGAVVVLSDVLVALLSVDTVGWTDSDVTPPVEATADVVESADVDEDEVLSVEVEASDDDVGVMLLDEDDGGTTNDGIAPVLESADDVEKLVEVAAVDAVVLSVELMIDEEVELVKVSVTVVVANPVVVASEVVYV